MSEIIFNKEARNALLKGVNIINNAIKITLGPKGRNAIIYENDKVLITNDGATIANAISSNRDIENIGINLVKEAAQTTNDVAGDGTTTATIITSIMMQSAVEAINNNTNPLYLKQGIIKATNQCLKKLKEKSKPIKTSYDIENIATISSGSKEIGLMIARALQQIGRDGVINIEEASTSNTTLEIVPGFTIDNGYINEAFISDEETLEIVLNNPYVLITNEVINNFEELSPLLEEIANERKELLIIANDFSKDVISALAINKIQKVLKVIPVRLPSFSTSKQELLEDLKSFSGQQQSTFIKEINNPNDLGKVDKAIIQKNKTTIINFENNSLQNARIDYLYKRLKDDLPRFEKERIEERLSKMSKGVALIKLSSATTTNLMEKKLKLEDAINATKAAIEEGIVIGGGCAFYEIAQELKVTLKDDNEDIQKGIDIVLKSISEPLKQIIINSGYDANKIITIFNNKDDEVGFDALTGKIVNLFEVGIIDPMKVLKSALTNASSITNTFLSTDVVIINKNNKKQLNPELI